MGNDNDYAVGCDLMSREIVAHCRPRWCLLKRHDGIQEGLEEERQRELRATEC